SMTRSPGSGPYSGRTARPPDRPPGRPEQQLGCRPSSGTCQPVNAPAPPATRRGRGSRPAAARNGSSHRRGRPSERGVRGRSVRGAGGGGEDDRVGGPGGRLPGRRHLGRNWPMTAPRVPVVFIHGLWLHADSWAPWVERFREAGYEPVAPGWPGDPDTVAEARAHPERLAGGGIDEGGAHYGTVVDGLAGKPVLGGHSFGGLVVEKLLGPGRAAAAGGL